MKPRFIPLEVTDIYFFVSLSMIIITNDKRSGVTRHVSVPYL